MKRTRRHAPPPCGMSRVTKLTEELSRRGYRVTRARRDILTFLSTLDSSFSVEEIMKGTSVDQATVYRTLALLEDEHMVMVLRGVHGHDEYELTDTHHAHAICTTCGVIAHMPCRAESLRKVPVPTLKKVVGHSVSFYGLCRKCG